MNDIKKIIEALNKKCASRERISRTVSMKEIIDMLKTNTPPAVAGD